MSYKEKYLKYKLKYLELKSQIGRGFDGDPEKVKKIIICCHGHFYEPIDPDFIRIIYPASKYEIIMIDNNPDKKPDIVLDATKIHEKFTDCDLIISLGCPIIFMHDFYESVRLALNPGGLFILPKNWTEDEMLEKHPSPFARGLQNPLRLGFEKIMEINKSFFKTREGAVKVVLRKI